MSRAVSEPKLSPMRVRTSGTATSPIGTLIQKIHSQLRPCTTAPPTSGPVATESPVMAEKMPIAAPRFSAGKAELSSASPIDISSADAGPLDGARARSATRRSARAHRRPTPA